MHLYIIWSCFPGTNSSYWCNNTPATYRHEICKSMGSCNIHPEYLHTRLGYYYLKLTVSVWLMAQVISSLTYATLGVVTHRNMFERSRLVYSLLCIVCHCKVFSLYIHLITYTAMQPYTRIFFNENPITMHDASLCDEYKHVVFFHLVCLHLCRVAGAHGRALMPGTSWAWCHPSILGWSPSPLLLHSSLIQATVRPSSTYMCCLFTS